MIRVTECSSFATGELWRVSHLRRDARRTAPKSGPGGSRADRRHVSVVLVAGRNGRVGIRRRVLPVQPAKMQPARTDDGHVEPANNALDRGDQLVCRFRNQHRKRHGRAGKPVFSWVHRQVLRSGWSTVAKRARLLPDRDSKLQLQIIVNIFPIVIARYHRSGLDLGKFLICLNFNCLEGSKIGLERRFRGRKLAFNATGGPGGNGAGLSRPILGAKLSL